MVFEWKKKSFVPGRVGLGVGRDCRFVKRYLQVRRADIAFLRFTLEAYDGLGFFRTLDNTAGIIEFCYPPSQALLAEGFLGAVRGECPWREVAAPQEIPPL